MKINLLPNKKTLASTGIFLVSASALAGGYALTTATIKPQIEEKVSKADVVVIPTNTPRPTATSTPVPTPTQIPTPTPTTKPVVLRKYVAPRPTPTPEEVIPTVQN